MPLSLRNLHRLSAVAIGIFLAIHIANHLAGLGGQGLHIAAMAAARKLYRNAFIEPLLLTLLAWQAASGLFMVARHWKTRRGAVAWLQALSGLYVALFLAIHVAAIFYGRALGLDTDFRYAAAGFHVAIWPWFFAPYYFLAIACLFAHLGCAIYWSSPVSIYRSAMLATILSLGAAAGLFIVCSLAGVFYPVNIPSQYLQTYAGPTSR